MAVSFVSLLFSMKCFWKPSAAPPAPIVVTAPQYSHTTSASPADGFIGPPHELHLKSCGIGGGADAWTGALGLYGWPIGAPPEGMPSWAPCAGATTPCFAPHKLQNTDPSAIRPPHSLQNKESPPIRTGDVGPVLLNDSVVSVRTATLLRVRDSWDHPQIARHAVPRTATADPHGTHQPFPVEDVPSRSARPRESFLPLLRHLRDAGRRLRGRRGDATRDELARRVVEGRPLCDLSARRNHDGRLLRGAVRPPGTETDPRPRALRDGGGGRPVHPEHQPSDPRRHPSVPRPRLLCHVRDPRRGTLELLRTVLRTPDIRRLLPVYVPVVALYGYVLSFTDHLIGTGGTAPMSQLLIVVGSLGIPLGLSLALSGRWSDRARRRRPFMGIGLACFGGLAILLAAATGPSGTDLNQLASQWPLIALLAAGAGTFPPAALAYLGDIVERAVSGTTFGIYSIIFGSGLIIGPILGGALTDAVGSLAFAVLALSFIGISATGVLFIREPARGRTAATTNVSGPPEHG